MRAIRADIRTVGELREALEGCDPTTPVEIEIEIDTDAYAEDAYAEDGCHRDTPDSTLTVDASTHSAQIVLGAW